MNHIAVPAAGIRKVKLAQVPGNVLTPHDGETEEIVIDSPHELDYTISGGTLTIHLVKAAPANQRSEPQTIIFGGETGDKFNVTISGGSAATTTVRFPSNSSARLEQVLNFSSSRRRRRWHR